MNSRALYLFVLLLFCTQSTFSQINNNVQEDGSSRSNIITAVPFLLIVPEAKFGSMGNAGVAIANDINSASINAAVMAFLPEKSLVTSVSYSPWLRSYAPDINLSYLSAFYKVNERSAIGTSLRYFSMGTIQLTGENSQNLGSATPNELAAEVSYSRTFGPSFALGGSFRYIYSNLTAGAVSNASTAGNAVAVDLSALYKQNVSMFNQDVLWSLGLSLSNIGTKISYGDNPNSFFLPANFRIGSALEFGDNENRLTLALDLNKLMVPTQPVYGSDGKIIKGHNPSRSVSEATFSSFYDAPGGITEELKEIGISTGAEYLINNTFALRGGYNYQNPSKGNARYFTLGAGIKYNILNIDVAYLVSSVKSSPLANTLRFTLQARFGGHK